MRGPEDYNPEIPNIEDSQSPEKTPGLDFTFVYKPLTRVEAALDEEKPFSCKALTMEDAYAQYFAYCAENKIKPKSLENLSVTSIN